jgi:trk system potassium uptake protein TrkH
LNVRSVITSVSRIVAVFGALMLVPAGVSLLFGEADWTAFLISSAITAAFGVTGLFLSASDTNQRVGNREGMAITALGWTACALFGALPFLLAGSLSTPADAVFETMSGLTTTGATVLLDVEAQSHAILFWRSFLHWLGGMGIVVLSIALLPGLQVGGSQLFRAEVPGPLPDRLEPRIRETAKRLWGIYILLTAVQAVLLRIFGMSLFDAVTHAFATVATGGFSTANKSLEAWNSPAIDMIVTVFMFLAGINFTLHYRALRGDFEPVRKDDELKTYAGIVLAAIVLISLDLLAHSNYSLGNTLRHSSFQVVSVITTTGFTTVNYDIWPPLSRAILLLLMFVGGCGGSTGGGMKVVRINVLAKHSIRELKRAVYPRRVSVVRLNDKAVPEEVCSSVLAFVILYLSVFLAAMLAMSAMGLDFLSAVGSVAATLGNIGPGFGLVGPTCNYSALPALGKWLLSFCMLVGRLEVYTVLSLFVPGFWRKP